LYEYGREHVKERKKGSNIFIYTCIVLKNIVLRYKYNSIVVENLIVYWLPNQWQIVHANSGPEKVQGYIKIIQKW